MRDHGFHVKQIGKGYLESNLECQEKKPLRNSENGREVKRLAIDVKKMNINMNNIVLFV